MDKIKKSIFGYNTKDVTKIIKEQDEKILSQQNDINYLRQENKKLSEKITNMQEENSKISQNIASNSATFAEIKQNLANNGDNFN